jgi:parvulin-like peptidyl-prolyl isomerase
MTGLRYAATLLLLVVVLSFAVASADDEKGETPVVKVNGVELRRSDLQIQIDKLLPQSLYHGAITPSKMKEIEKKALQALVEEELYYQEAKKQGLTADENAVRDRLNEVRKMFSSEEAMNETLKRNNMTMEMFREKVVRLQLVENLVRKETRVSFSDKELDEYYGANKEKFIVPESVRLRYIWIMFDPTAPDFRAKAKAKADEAFSRLKAGIDFSQVAWNYADNMSRVKGGDMGFIHRGRLPKDVEEVAFSLKKGELSDVIENDTGYHIMRVEDRKESRQLSFDEIRSKLERSLVSAEEKKRKAALLDRLKANARIEYMTEH